jgi:hypothetical protein
LYVAYGSSSKATAHVEMSNFARLLPPLKGYYIENHVGHGQLDPRSIESQHYFRNIQTIVLMFDVANSDEPLKNVNNSMKTKQKSKSFYPRNLGPHIL